MTAKQISIVGLLLMCCGCLLAGCSADLKGSFFGQPIRVGFSAGVEEDGTLSIEHWANEDDAPTDPDPG